MAASAEEQENRPEARRLRLGSLRAPCWRATNTMSRLLSRCALKASPSASETLEPCLDKVGEETGEWCDVLANAGVFERGHVGIALLDRDHGPGIAA